jgi:hypothetical protein
VHDESLVREADRVDDREHEPHDRRHVEREAPGVRVDRFAFDVFEHEVRLAGRRRAAVDQPRDVRMRQPRENLPFAREQRERGGVGNAAQQLDRRDLLEMPVVALRAVDRAHAAVADFADERPHAEAVADLQLVAGDPCQREQHGLGDAVRAERGLREQRAHFVDDRRIVLERGQARFALGVGQVGQFIEQRFDARERFPLHGGP